MAKHLIKYYPILSDKSAASEAEWSIRETSSDDTEESTSSTLILERNQARHYKTLQEMYKTKARPNKKDVSQLLDLEFQTKWAFIDSDAIKESWMNRILDQGNFHFIPDLKTRFYEKAGFYGVFKKVMKAPQQDKVQHSLALIKALPDMFPPPKKLGHTSEAMFHSAEDPNTFLQVRPLFSPVVIVCETNCLLAIGTMPVVTYPKEDICASVMYLMACYYAFHLTYPKCIATLLSVL
ncbi:hypothetical protein HF521_003874 [Silurus meridionalis]|uniref:Uncharacterized protein n=1 Tax=Silurus meridionalis TaxID=175797 RepID=A0A8T0B2A6_SILME|nr:hypothetical protein HF521_003874 [Silurus meridionalis]